MNKKTIQKNEYKQKLRKQCHKKNSCKILFFPSKLNDKQREKRKKGGRRGRGKRNDSFSRQRKKVREK